MRSSTLLLCLFTLLFGLVLASSKSNKPATTAGDLYNMVSNTSGDEGEGSEMDEEDGDFDGEDGDDYDEKEEEGAEMLDEDELADISHLAAATKDNHFVDAYKQGYDQAELATRQLHQYIMNVIANTEATCGFRIEPFQGTDLTAQEVLEGQVVSHDAISDKLTHSRVAYRKNLKMIHKLSAQAIALIQKAQQNCGKMASTA